MRNRVYTVNVKNNHTYELKGGILMRSVLPMRTAKIGYIVISAALCLLGISAIAFPGFMASFIGVICGILLIAFGCIRIVGYLSRDLYRLAFQYDLTLGILLIALGIMMLISPKSFMTFMCIALGLYILADALFKVQIASESKRFGIGPWWLILALAIITGVCGLMLMFRPGQSSDVLMILFGITLLSEGILNISTAIATVKIIKHQQPDVIEVKYYSDKESEE